MKKNTSGQKKTYPLVSVVIPVFNGCRYLTEAITSVQNNSYKNIEIILIDDGSLDQSKKLCQLLTKKYSNIKFFSFSRNTGLGRILNFALKMAKGKYICRINQDDRMLKDRIKTQLNFLREHLDVVAVGSQICLFFDHNKKQTVHFPTNDTAIRSVWQIVSPFSDPSVMYRKEIALKVGGYDQNFWPADDSQLWYRLSQHGKLANIDKVLVEVRFHNEAASVKYFRKLAISTYKMHLWFAENIEKPTIAVRLFWLLQLGAGLTLSPQLNWKIYRLIKRGLSYYYRFLLLLKSKRNKITMLNKVNSHPIKLSFSGK